MGAFLPTLVSHVQVKMALLKRTRKMSRMGSRKKYGLVLTQDTITDCTNNEIE